jgi:hypothetical protein
MLAKCRCESIAKLAALSAPDAYLPRLLLCCGITSTSLLSMIERLGKIGNESPDASKYFSQLLAPSAISSWGTGYQAVGRRVVARKLHGRISAYLDLNEPDCSIAKVQSSPFLSWLVDYCNNTKDKKAPRSKTASKAQLHLPDFLTRAPTQGSLAKLLLDEEEDELDPLPFEAQYVLAFDATEMSDEVFSPSCDGGIAADALERAIAANDFRSLDSMASSLVQGFESSSSKVQNIPREAARNLLAALSKPMVESIGHHPSAFVNFVLKWYPFLSQFGWCNDIDGNAIFEVIFNRNNNAVLYNKTWSSILRTCSEFSWTEAQIRSCQAWILDGAQNDEFLTRQCPLRMVDFLVHTSNQFSLAFRPFAGASAPPFAALGSQAHASSAVKIALECARVENCAAPSAFAQRCADRNMLPPWLILLELTARCSKKHLTFVTDTLVSQLSSDGWKGIVYPLVLLRLYLHLPSMMSLGDAKLREVLVSAVGNHRSGWMEWRCPLDDQVQSMVQTLGSNWSQRLLQTMMDLSKRQPLIVLRHLRSLADVLLQDGAIVSNNALNSRNRTVAGAAQGAAVAKTKQGAVLKVTATHWGYCFTEPLWSSVLEILSSFPNEVAFACGLQMGFVDIYEAFIKLIWVQHSLNCSDLTARIRTKLAASLASFNSFNALSWAEWMESRLDGLRKQGPVRDIVAKCDIKC